MTDLKAKLLIVDDEPAIRKFMASLLTEIGYHVRCAEDGFSALHDIRKSIPDILLCDLNMPGMSGFELLSVVRRRFSAIHVVAMSGAFCGNEVPSGVAADAFYQKGSSMGCLLRILRDLTQTERRTLHPSSFGAPVWIQRNGHDAGGEPYVTIACPECLRTFPQVLGDSTSPLRETECIHCRSSIHYAVVPSLEQASLLPFQHLQPSGTPILQFARRSI